MGSFLKGTTRLASLLVSLCELSDFRLYSHISGFDAYFHIVFTKDQCLALLVVAGSKTISIGETTTNINCA